VNRILARSPLGRLVVLALRRAGFQSFVVGGAVRDLFLGREPNDIDIATNMPATEMNRLAFTDDMFRELGIERCDVTFIPVGVEFGVAAFAMNGEVIEVANFRLDLAFDGNHRGVTVGVAETIEEDLVRRDFSMNAMAMDPFEEDIDKALVDPFGGREALAKGIIDTPGSPDMSFEQDALRILRAVRFMARFGFSLAPGIFVAARKRLVRQRFRLISRERIRDELMKILTVDDGNAVATAFTVMQEMGVLKLFMPELSALVNLPFMKEHHTDDPFNHTMLALSQTPPDLVLRLAVLFHDLGKRFTLEPGTFATPGHADVSKHLAAAVMKRLRMPVALIPEVTHLVGSHMDGLTDGKTSRRLKRSGFFRFGEDHLDRAYLVRRADLLGRGPKHVQGRLSRLHEVFEELRGLAVAQPLRSVKELPVNGRDVMTITGMRPGPSVGAILRTLFDRLVNGELPEDREQLLMTIRLECGRE
jgi:tRNA nucleotidyltransferase (CCA-adding enzyme)